MRTKISLITLLMLFGLISYSSVVLKIHEAIAKEGHDTELLKSSDKTYNDLPGCCQYDPSVSTQFSITNSPVANTEIVCNKENMGKIIAITSEHGRTGNPGDGLIYVSNVEKAYWVKTGLENGE